MQLADLILDAWSPLSHKAAIGDGTTTTNSLAPSWVPPSERRRLDAYKVLAAYRLNVARVFLPTELDKAIRDARREYGDPDLLIDRVVASVLGDDVEIVVEGADADLPDQPDLPPVPDEAGPDATDIQRRVADVRRRIWDATTAQIVDEWETAWSQQPALLERQAWLRQWADDELLLPKIVETEGDIVGLADGVYTLAWSTAKQRPVVDIYDPGFYFPVLTDSTREFPDRLHLAWEFEQDDGRKFVRRLTWELGAIRPQVDFDGFPVIGEDGGMVLLEGDRTVTDDVGFTRIVRTYPWNVDPDTGQSVDSDITCYFTDATWPWADLGDRRVDDFDPGKAIYATTEDGLPARQLDLRIDFNPVIHVPNTPAHRDHYGKSILSGVAQILDDISASDTDVQAAAALAAGPMVALAGATLPKPKVGDAGYDPRLPPDRQPSTLRVKPGTVFPLPAEGRMDVLDLSKGLEQLRQTNAELREHLSVNGRVPAEVLGRVKASEVPSGVALALAFSPFTQLIGVLRMTREPKYRLLLKFAQRLAQAGGTLEAGANPPARIAFGSFLPSDRNQLVSDITKLIQARALSTQTAVALLVAGGFTIDDAKAEVQRIRYENPEAAKHLADATGSEELAAEWLGVDLPETPAPTPTPTPPAPPGPTPPTPPAGQ